LRVELHVKTSLLMLAASVVDDLQSGVSDVQHRAEFDSISTPVDVHSASDDRHLQVRRQQEPAKDQLSHVHGE